jgi:hypothetical protein
MEEPGHLCNSHRIGDTVRLIDLGAIYNTERKK